MQERGRAAIMPRLASLRPRRASPGSRIGLRQLLIGLSLAGIVPLAIVATVLLVALLRTQQARFEETAGAEAHALAALLVIVLVASGLFAWLIGRRIAGAIHAAASAAAAMSSGKPLPLVPSRVEEVQKLMQAQLDFQQREGAYNALMMKALQRAYGVFQDKLAEREEPGRQLTSARALFDLWIDAAEEAYAQVALSPEFREVYGAYVNAQMRLRNGMQREVEQACAAMGMPTRTEVDAAHRKIAELERVLRRMRDAGGIAGNAANPEPRATASAKPAVAGKPAAKRAAATRKKPATKPAPTAKRKR